MREFDSNGLRLAEYQGKIFEYSHDFFDCSTNIFIRRFVHSNLLKSIDKNDSSLLSLDPYEGLESIKEQFGESDYGSFKQNKEALFWVGYFYRYISYTRNVDTVFLMKIFDYRKMFEVYYVYHTQDFEWCIADLLEIYGYSEDIFDPNYRLRIAIKKLRLSKNECQI
ncbi:MAG: hypothetical protein K5892_02455 [Acholeplasmatales bacterium]|nr:hypothetical protein [Acholeplasmatales bacterium]